LCGGDKSTQTRGIEKAHQLADEWRSEEDEDNDGEK
jgi:putative component of toxin-antitoxin plasmid stabilization module